MMRTLYRTRAGGVRTDLGKAGVATALKDPDGLLWVDLSPDAVESGESILREVFSFHPLAVDDALEETHVPRLDDWEGYLYLALHSVLFDERAEEPLTTVELDAFLGPNYLVTYHARSITALERVWSAAHRGERPLKRSAPYLLYRLSDELVSQYMPVVEQIDDTIDAIEDQVFGEPTSSTLQQIFTMKRALLRLRRVIGPQREVFNRLARGDHRVVTSEDRVFFRDIYDDLVRLHDLSESLRDLVSSALDSYLSVVNNRMNEVMKVLTVITTLFMPLSFLVGFFGMNFFQASFTLEAWTSPAAFVIMLASMVLAPLGMAIWMQRRGWM